MNGFEQRFMPLFALMFGISFGILRSPRRNPGPAPRLALLRRVLFLIVIGLFHQVIAPGESLLVFGVVGLILLLPMSWIPHAALPWATGILGAAGIVWSVAAGGMEAAKIAGLILCGFGVAASGALRHLEKPATDKACGIAAGVLWLLSAALLGWRIASGMVTIRSTWSHELLGMFMMLAIAATVLWAMGTSARPVLVALFEPLGKAAMSAYVSASIAIYTLGRILMASGAHGLENHLWAWLIPWTIGVLFAQNLFFGWYVRTFGRGPLEQLWRRFTWWNARGVQPGTTKTAEKVAVGGASS